MTHPLYTPSSPAWGRARRDEPKPANAVPPRRIDRVHGPVHGPVLRDPTPAPARAGAEDHKRHASRGLGC